MLNDQSLIKVVKRTIYIGKRITPLSIGYSLYKRANYAGDLNGNSRR